jgi:long-chain-fatty-acid--[acyl-carrier-protein] ligase
MEKINHVDFGSVADQIVLLEDIRKSLSLKDKLKGLIFSHLPPNKLLKKLKMDQIDENSTSVILFTSGTEAMPKGVPLSHKNILSTVRHCFWNFRASFNSQAVIYNILPQFHSFGLAVSTFVPIFSGVRVAFYPNPADSFAIAKGTQRWKITHFPIVPNFLKKLFQAAKPEELKTVRIFATAGEKTPSELFDTLKKMGLKAEILEGYGLSETSPVITLTRPHEGPKGVGKLLPDIEAIAIHPETHDPLPVGQTGEICVRGPNVFGGYLGNAASPFIEIDGKSWFLTGDVGYVDEDDSLILTGRLKRFIKLGGEMISLGAIEEALIAEYRRQNLVREDVPSLALCSDETDLEHPKLILYTIFPLEKESVNEVLKNLGFSNLIKVSSIERVDEIPVTSTGKTHYRSLK